MKARRVRGGLFVFLKGSFLSQCLEVAELVPIILIRIASAA